MNRYRQSRGTAVMPKTRRTAHAIRTQEKAQDQIHAAPQQKVRRLRPLRPGRQRRLGDRDRSRMGRRLILGHDLAQLGHHRRRLAVDELL